MPASTSQTPSPPWPDRLWASIAPDNRSDVQAPPLMALAWVPPVFRKRTGPVFCFGYKRVVYSRR
jgi:hypothetical protein